MSIIHDALRRAEDEKEPRAGVAIAGRAGRPRGLKRQSWQILASVGVLCLGLAALIAAFSLFVGGDMEQTSRVSGQKSEGTSRGPDGLDSQRRSNDNPALGSLEQRPAHTPSAEAIVLPELVAEAADAAVGDTGVVEPPNDVSAASDERSPARSLAISLSEADMAVSRMKRKERSRRGSIDIQEVSGGPAALQMSRERTAACLAHLSNARAFRKKGKLEEALAEYELALSKEPDNEMALLGIGSFLLDRKSYSDAERYLRTGIGTERGSNELKSALHTNLGLTLFMMGMIDEAGREYQKAIALNEGNINVYNNLAVVYKRLGKLELARRTYCRILLMDNRAPLAYYGLGVLYDGRGKPDEAVHNYSRFLVLAGRRFVDIQEKVRARVAQIKIDKSERRKKKKRSTPGPYMP